MNHEAILIQLRRMTAEVEAERVKLIPGPLPQHGSHGYLQIRIKCEEWLRKAELVERQIRSRQALADLRHDQARFTAHAWQARDRHRSVSRTLSVQRDAVEDFTLAVMQLWDKLNGGMGEGEARAKALNDAVKNIMKALENDEAIQLQDARAIVEHGSGAGSPQAPQFHPGLGTGLLTLTIFLLTLLARRNRD